MKGKGVPVTSDEKKKIFLNAGLCLWFLSLAAYFYSSILWTLVFASLTFVSFIIHVIRKRDFIMFRKEKSVPIATTIHQIENESSVQEQKKSTVIASEVHFEGNITSSGQIYIYGEVHGNVVSNGGLVKIMRNGLVKGNIACGTLVIDGTLIGECKSESIDIHEHGKINGSLAYTTLSVKNGGVFIGKAETFTKPDSEINVITFVPGEMITTPAEDTPCNATGTN